MNGENGLSRTVPRSSKKLEWLIIPEPALEIDYRVKGGRHKCVMLTQHYDPNRAVA